jgi:tetratricopeptide (TPR) repeat protein
LAEHPYKIQETGLLIYSAEELSYYIFNNFYLIDEGFVSDELFSFLEAELGLAETAVHLRKLRDERAGLGVLLLAFLREVHYYSETELRAFQIGYDTYRHQGTASRKVQKADFLLEHGHFLAAIQIYRQFEHARKDPTLPKDFYMKIKQHMAVGYIHLGLLQEALDSFLEAYKDDPTEELLKQIYQFSCMSGLTLPSELYKAIKPEWESQWRGEYEEVSTQGGLLATTGPTAALFTKDAVRRKEALAKHIEGIKRAYRTAIS